MQIVSAPAPPHDPTCLYEVVCGKPCPCGVTSGTTKYCQDDSQKEPERVASAMSIEEMDRKDRCECPPKTKNVDKSVATIRESTSEEDSEEITIPEKTKVRETNKMKTLSKERSISKSKSKEKSSKIDRKPSPIEVIKKDKGSQHDTNLKKSSYQKLGKGEDSSSSEKEKVGSDELKPKKEGKGEKEKKKRVKCHCEEVSDDDSDTKPNEREDKPSCCCARRRYKGVASKKDKDKDTDKEKDKDKDREESEKQLSLIEIVGHCDGSCCCSQCGAK